LTGNIQLTLACGDYEIVRALKEQTIKPDGIDLTVLTDMDSGTRHWRFLRNNEFDVAELSCSSYLVARDRGMAYQAIPVFLHRRFRHGFIYINTSKGIKEPSDLIGKKIGLKQFQSTAIVWMRGILAHEYGVPFESVEWFPELDESVDFDPPPNIKITRLPDEKSLVEMLVTGELDAALHPELIKPIIEHDPRVSRLFPAYREEEMRYYQKTGIFPIMHILGIKQEIIDCYPWVPINLQRAFDQSKNIAMARMANPRIVPLVFYRDVWEEQEEIFGLDPWEHGLSDRNRRTLNVLINYTYEQGQIKSRPSIDDLFVNVHEGRKRGDSTRI